MANYLDIDTGRSCPSHLRNLVKLDAQSMFLLQLSNKVTNYFTF